jgi:hypothetical protein
MKFLFSKRSGQVRQAVFSLADPEAGMKLVSLMEKEELRLSFRDVCGLFGCAHDPIEASRVRGILMGLEAEGRLNEPEPDIYCLPSMAEGQEDDDDGRPAPEPPKRSVMRAKPEPKPPIFARSPRGGVAATVEWLLRWILATGFAKTRPQMIEAALKAGLIGDPFEIELPFRQLVKKGYLQVLFGDAHILTDEGFLEAHAASARAHARGDKPIPIPEEMLPPPGAAAALFHCDDE